MKYPSYTNIKQHIQLISKTDQDLRSVFFLGFFFFEGGAIENVVNKSISHLKNVNSTCQP